MTTHGPHNTPSDETPADWQPCPQGELGQLVGQLRTRKRNSQIRRATQVASVVAGGVFAVAVAWFALIPAAAVDQPGVAQPAARISCKEVRERTMEFVSGKVDADTKTRIETHLGKCRKCEKYVHDHRPQVSAAPASGLSSANAASPGRNLASR